MPPTIARLDAAVADRLARVVQRDQRRRAGRIDRQARPVQVEDVGDPVGEDAQRRAGHEVRIAARRIAEAQIAVVGRGPADIDAGRRTRELARRNAGILDRVPHQLEQDALLRVHLRRLARRDPEKRRLEQIDIGDQPGRPGIALARLAVGRMVVEAGRPPAGIDLGDRVGAGNEQLPERLQAGSAGKPAGSAYDRDRSITHALRLFQCPCHGAAGRPLAQGLAHDCTPLP